jgi:hypothetical protein
MFACAVVARPAFRWQVLHWGARERCVLPTNLSRTYGQRKECSLLPYRCSCRRSGIPAMPALPTGMFAGDTCMAGHLEHGRACVTSHRRRWIGGRSRTARRPIGYWLSPFATALPEASGCNAQCGGANPSAPFRQEIDRRNYPADDTRGPSCGIRLCSAIQCLYSRHLSPHADPNPASSSTDHSASGKPISLSASLSPSL